MTVEKKLRILIVEDDELFRLGLSTRFQRENSLQVVAEAVDSESAIALTNHTQPDVVLLDIGLPGVGGVETCRRIKQQHPDLPILVLTAHFQKPLIEQLIAAGASGFCLKGIEVDTLFLALRSVAAGASWWDRHSTKEIHTAYAAQSKTNEVSTSASSAEALLPRRESTADGMNLLTQREREILSLMAKGHNNQEIAAWLNITVGTVRVHVHAVLQKLNVRDRTQAVILALQNS